jgi:transposase
LVSGLVAGLSVDAAAEKADLSRTVAYQIIKRPDVRAQLSEASSEATSTAARKAAALVGEAVEVLAELARGAKAESVRRQAASDLLSHARAFRVDAEVDQRMAELAHELDAIVLAGASRAAA